VSTSSISKPVFSVRQVLKGSSILHSFADIDLVDTAQMGFLYKAYSGSLSIFHRLDLQEGRLNQELKSRRLIRSTRERLKNQLDACRANRARLRGLMEPFLSELKSKIHEKHRLGLHHVDQIDFLEYLDSFPRDWSWGQQEIEEIVKLYAGLFASTPDLSGKVVLFPGVGTAGVAVALHKAFQIGTSVGLDVNPLVLLLAKRLVSGDSFDFFFEAPSPLYPEAEKPLRLAGERIDGFHFLCGDFRQNHFQKGSFDVVITTWFLDVLGDPVFSTAAKIRALLKPGGEWWNVGPRVYKDIPVAHRSSPEEILQLVEMAGFTVEKQKQEMHDYFRSPVSGFHRRYHVLGFRAVADREPATEAPNWLEDEDWARNHDLKIGVHFNTSELGEYFVLKAKICALADGESSVNDIAQMLSGETKLPVELLREEVVKTLKGE
jgi:hypothetical protein